MATGTIKKPVQIVTRINNQLTPISNVITPALNNNNNMVLLSISRFGRSAGVVMNGSGLVGLTAGYKLNFGADDATITITGNGSNGFSITSSISALTDVYITLVEIMA